MDVNIIALNGYELFWRYFSYFFKLLKDPLIKYWYFCQQPIPSQQSKTKSVLIYHILHASSTTLSTNLIV